MKSYFFIFIFLIFSTASFATEKMCEPTKKFTDFVRDQKVFTSNNPKKSITQYSTENNITPECVRDMLSALTNQFAVEWVNKSKALNCYDEKSKSCPEETKKEIFGNINLFEQWNQWLSSNQNPAPDFSLCAEQFSADSFVKLTSSLSPILSVLKKEERMKFVLDLQKLNCDEGENVSAADSPNLEYFKKLKEKGMNAPIEDFFKLWYPSKKAEREDDPYFFKCQDVPWAPLTKKIPAPDRKDNPYIEVVENFKSTNSKMLQSFKSFVDSLPKMTKENRKKLEAELAEIDTNIKISNKKIKIIGQQLYLNFYVSEVDPRWKKFEKLLEENEKNDSAKRLEYQSFIQLLPRISKEQSDVANQELRKIDENKKKIFDRRSGIYFQMASDFYLPEADSRLAEARKKGAELEAMREELQDKELAKIRFDLAQESAANFLAEECKPDVLYSWGPDKKLKAMQEIMKDGEEWSKSPNPIKGDENTMFFMSMSPLSTLAYGPKSVRVKIKKSTPYRLISNFVELEDRENKQAKEVQVRIEKFQDFTTQDSSIIESWSYGTPEQYDEMVREAKRFYENKRAQGYDYLARNFDHINKIEGLGRLYQPVDGYSADEKNLKERLLTHIDMILKGEGKIFYQKGSCRNREESFRTRKPTYFNPG